MRILQVLARLKTAYRPEIASLAGISESHVRNLLRQLQGEGLIERRQTIGKYEGYAIRTKGLSLVHPSWNIPKGVYFTKYKGEFGYAGERHRRKARLWRAWLEKAYPNIDIWESWTEVPIQRGIPDGMWMAGAGVKGGTADGATDEYGYYSVEDRMHIHDMHATMLHILGLDHLRLTYFYGGRGADHQGP